MDTWTNRLPYALPYAQADAFFCYWGSSTQYNARREEFNCLLMRYIGER